jgi:hypothetical protein
MWTEKRLTLPSGHFLDSAYIDSEYVPPTEEERRRGEFRQDIQRAIGSIEFPVNIGGMTRPVHIAHSVGANGYHRYWLMGFKTEAGGQKRKMGARAELFHYPARHPDDTPRTQQDIDRALAEVVETIRRDVPDIEWVDVLYPRLVPDSDPAMFTTEKRRISPEEFAALRA